MLTARMLEGGEREFAPQSNRERAVSRRPLEPRGFECAQTQVDVELEEVDAAWAFRHGDSVETRSDGTDPPLALARWTSSNSAPLACRPARAPKRRSRCSRNVVTPPARSTS